MRVAYLIKSDLVDLCTKNKYFTQGTSSQYNKMLELVTDDCNAECIASVIYACSNGVSFRKILREVEQIIKAYSQLEGWYFDKIFFTDSKQFEKYLSMVYPKYNKANFKSLIYDLKQNIPKGSHCSVIESYIRYKLSIYRKSSITLPENLKVKPENEGIIVYGEYTFNKYTTFKEFLSKMGFKDTTLYPIIWNDLIGLNTVQQGKRLDLWFIQNNDKPIYNQYFKFGDVKYEGMWYTFEELYYLVGGTNINSCNFELFSNKINYAFNKYNNQEFRDIVNSYREKVIYDEKLFEINNRVLYSVKELESYIQELWGYDVTTKEVKNWINSILHLDYNSRTINFIQSESIFKKKDRILKKQKGESREQFLKNREMKRKRTENLKLEGKTFHSYTEIVKYMCEKYNIDMLPRQIRTKANKLNAEGVFDIEDESELSTFLNNYFAGLKNK